MTSPRSRQAHRLAETALSALLDAVGDRWRDLVVIGGLVPEFVVDVSEPHQGTGDVDVLIDLGLQYDRDDADFGWLERALVEAGFIPSDDNIGWRWLIEVDTYPVLVEFLVDVPDNRGQELYLPGATRLGAMNLAGPAPALRDTKEIHIGHRQAMITDIGGYLVAKAAAISGRAQRKDLYDFAYVIIHSERRSPGRAARAAAAIATPTYDYDPSRAVLQACGSYDSAESEGPIVYAREARTAGATGDPETLALDAAAAVAAFAQEFRRLRDPQ